MQIFATRWTKKNNENHYGYTNHTKVDAGSKLIGGYVRQKQTQNKHNVKDKTHEKA